MNKKIVETPNGSIAIIRSDDVIIKDGQTSLDFIVNAGTYLVVINKAAVAEDFFNLSTGIAGEVVQKFVNYGYRLVIVGDFSKYTSKALLDYIYECNNGKHLNFVATEDEALSRLSV